MKILSGITPANGSLSFKTYYAPSVRANPYAQNTITLVWIKATEKVLFPSISNGGSPLWGNIDGIDGGSPLIHMKSFIKPLILYEGIGCGDMNKSRRIRGLDALDPGHVVDIGRVFRIRKHAWVPLVFLNRAWDTTTVKEMHLEVSAVLNPKLIDEIT